MAIQLQTKEMGTGIFGKECGWIVVDETYRSVATKDMLKQYREILRETHYEFVRFVDTKRNPESAK